MEPMNRGHQFAFCTRFMDDVVMSLGSVLKRVNLADDWFQFLAIQTIQNRFVPAVPKTQRWVLTRTPQSITEDGPNLTWLSDISSRQSGLLLVVDGNLRNKGRLTRDRDLLKRRTKFCIRKCA
uniref:Uncharacterized protein n=1 Tax=Romanomermis culicivorax TaxID=13658 RepID=A0A915J0D5_ROMCU